MTHDAPASHRPAMSAPSAPATAALGLAGLLSLSVAMGFGRFSFTPMLPLMIADGQADIASGGWIAAANYVGYLVGALTAGPLARHPLRMARLALGLTLLLLAAMALPLGPWGWAVVRTLAGAASAWAFVATSVWCLGALAQRSLPEGPSGWSSGFYAGVGIGIMLTGFYCMAAASAGVGAASLWLQLAGLGAVLIVPVMRVMRGLQASQAGGAAAATGVVSAPAAIEAHARTAKLVDRPPVSAPASHALMAAGASTASAGLWSPRMRPLAVAYGLFGFGYILPATFLPALARTLVPDPRLFGLTWPLWGLAALLSVLLAVWWLRHASRLRVWAVTQALMGVGALAPSLWLSGWTIALSALLVGGTFMVMTLAAVQEARVRGGATVLPRMTAAFALGQIVGPVLANALGHLPGLDATTSMNLALQIAAASLLVSAAWLAWEDRVTRPTPAR